MNIQAAEKKKQQDIEVLQTKQNERSMQAGAENMQNMPFAEIFSEAVKEAVMNTDETQILPDITMQYDAVSMDLDDALFFINLAENAQFSVQSAPDGSFQNLMKLEVQQTSAVQKSAAVTNKVVNLIEEAQKTQKPVRISFDNDISVVLKIDKKGKLSAEFIPGSIEAERYLTANVSALKQRFDEQSLPYTNISYRNRNRQNRQNNKGEA